MHVQMSEDIIVFLSSRGPSSTNSEGREFIEMLCRTGSVCRYKATGLVALLLLQANGATCLVLEPSQRQPNG